MTATKLRERIETYFAQRDAIRTPAGLAVFLGTDTDRLRALAAGKNAAGTAVRQAMARLEQELLENALLGRYNATMSTFLLKCCFGYHEKRGPSDEPPDALRVELGPPLDRLAR